MVSEYYGFNSNLYFLLNIFYTIFFKGIFLSFFTKIIILLSVFISVNCCASPKISITYDINPQNFARIKVKNKTMRTLGCYVAIDGYKRKFTLTALASSKWIKATDTRFKYTDFSVFCDYKEYVK
jgi:hypothetical protein